jgi:hypothetical protein
MADENKIQLDVELSDSSIDKSFKAIDDRAEKSAKQSAAVFGEAFQRQEQDLKSSIDRIVGETKKVAQKSAKESAAAFAEAFEKQDKIYRASVKQNIDNAIDAITGSSRVKKSAQESASVFEEAFAKEITGNKTIDNALNAILPAANASSALGVGFARLLGPVGLVTAGVTALGVAAKQSIDLIVAGESEIKLDKKFEILAAQAGIAGSALRDDLTKAVDGLVGQSELLEVASQSFVQLGNNAKQLPQILELARKTYAVFGGDVVKNTEAITNAIFTGQTRQLKQLGILVDTEKVYKEYARSIGTVVPLLNEQQKQQAILNEVLSQGNERFKNVDAESGKATTAIGKFNVALKDLRDNVSILASNALSGFASSVTNAVTSALQSINQAIDPSPAARLRELDASIEKTRQSIESYKKSIEGFGALEQHLDAGFSANRVRVLNVELEKQIKLRDELKAKIESSAPAIAEGGGGGSSAVSDEYLRRRQELVTKVQALNEQLQQSELQLAQDEFQRNQNKTNLELLTYEQRLAAAMKFEQDKAALEKFYKDNGVVDEELRNQGREALEMQHVNNLLKIDKGYADQKKKIEKTANDQSYAATSTALSQIATLQENATGELAAIGKAAAITKATIDGYVAVQNALAQVPYPFNFAAAALVGVAAAANVAKIASAGPGGGGGSAAFTPVTGGGSTGDISSPVVEAPAPEDTVAQTPGTAINLTINGNVLDRRETGLEIAQILEEQFADQGLTIRGA